MSTTLLKNTQKVRGFQHRSFEYLAEKLIWRIKRQKFQCSYCGSKKLFIEELKEKQVQGLPMERSLAYLQFKVHRIYCYRCHYRTVGKFHFLSSPKSRISKELELRIRHDRHEMSIRSVAEKYRLRWELVKEVEKRHLERKYARIQTAHVRRIGMKFIPARIMAGLSDI